jgi:mono/diheme cytochrome c family protein
MRRGVTVLFLVLVACPKDETLVLNFEEEPAQKTEVAPSGEKILFDRPPVHKASVEKLPDKEQIDPSKLPQVQRDVVKDPHSNVPNYKELGEANKAAMKDPHKIAGTNPRLLFLNHCGSCHSFDGSGHVKNPIPGIVDLRSDRVTKKSDAQLYKAIANGHGKARPYVDVMDGAQITGLVTYVRSLPR